MVSVKDVPADDFVNALAAHLKSSGKIQLPKWNDIVKTGKNRELPPTNPDWFYVRAASLARRVYLAPNRGVGTLSVVYGGHKRNGVRRGHAYRSCTGILRNALQQLEKANIITKATSGRSITKNGQRVLDTVAGTVHGKGVLSVWKSTF